MGNVYNRPYNLRTTNMCESWHSSLDRETARVRPSLWTFFFQKFKKKNADSFFQNWTRRKTNSTKIQMAATERKNAEVKKIIWNWCNNSGSIFEQYFYCFSKFVNFMVIFLVFLYIIQFHLICFTIQLWQLIHFNNWLSTVFVFELKLLVLFQKKQ